MKCCGGDAKGDTGKDDDASTLNKSNRGSHRSGWAALWSLRNWWVWDITVFLSLAFVGVWYANQRSVYEWQTRAMMFMLRMMYGLLSFPFVFWKVPGHLHVFTKTDEKGYRRDGTTADRIGRKKKDLIERGEWSFQDEENKRKRSWTCTCCYKHWYRFDDFASMGRRDEFGNKITKMSQTEELLWVRNKEGDTVLGHLGDTHCPFCARGVINTKDHEHHRN